MCLSKVLGSSGRLQSVVLSLLLCVGGGVLLATAMLHIMPEIAEELAEPGEKLGRHVGDGS